MPTTQKSTVKTGLCMGAGTIWHSQCSRMLIRLAAHRPLPGLRIIANLKY